MTEDAQFDLLEGTKGQTIFHDNVLTPIQPGSSSVPCIEEGAATEKEAMETSYDYLFEGELQEKRGTTSNILAHGDHLIGDEGEKEITNEDVALRSQSVISDLIVSQENSIREVERLTGLLAHQEAEIANLKDALQQASIARTEEPGPLSTLRQENEELKAKVGDLT
ncbi:hypothetical protein HAX54_014572 [Datura stramonium]|uniref:Uncharacterized protein n=1 Tax=Datura stramonium TaxID=4076 RepID=A0ABS8TQ48_DATST|nr:hypothetical protein [Datura stramonium]